MLTFPVEDIFVMLTQKTAKGKTIRELRRQPFMHGIIIKKVKRTGVELPILANTKLQAGDLLEIVGMANDIKQASPKLGYVDRPTNKTDLIFVGLGILIGGIVGALTIRLGGIPISLKYQWRGFDIGFVFRMAENQTSDLWPYSRSGGMDF